MKNLLLFLTLLVSGFCFSQDSIPYFPQEQLIHPECSTSDDFSNCLYNILKSNIINNFEEEFLSKDWQKDTLTVQFIFSVNDHGRITNNFSVSIHDKSFGNEVTDNLKKIVEDLPKFKILNRKPKKYLSRHFIDFYFVKELFEGKEKLLALEPKNIYLGGAIGELPIFPGCKDTENDNTECFNKMLIKHVRENFRYPMEAQERGIQGIVYVIFIISKSGEVTNIRIRGPHELINNEALRIVKRLPKMEPGKLNGEPVRVPFSFPITFKLQ